jgi:cell division protein FtsB
MRYWGAEEQVTKAGRRTTPRRRKTRTATTRSRGGTPVKPSVTTGGSVKPFLRRFYRHQAVVSRPVQRLFLFLMIAGLIYAFVLGDAGVVRIVMLRHDRSQLDRQIAELQYSADILENEITLLTTDPFFIEKAGRERFKYVRPDEHVYRVIPEDSAD